MKKGLKKVLSLLLGMTMTVGLLAGCGSKNTTNSGMGTSTEPGTSENGESDSAGTSEHVELKMYLLGDRTPDFDEVYGKINEILEEKLNCSVSVDFLSWGEHDTLCCFLRRRILI